MKSWQLHGNSHPWTQEDDRNNVDEHRDNDGGNDNDDHRGAVETNAGESDRADENRVSPAFAVEAIRQFNANAIACHLKTGDRQWYIVWCYLALFNNTTIIYVEAAMVEWPRGVELIFAEDLNLYLERTGGQGLEKEITVAVATVGIEEISAHFLPLQRPCNWYQRTWAVVKQGREMRSQTDYILGSDRQIFQNVAVQDPKHNSSHYMVMGFLRGAPLREHSYYLIYMIRLPLSPPGRQK